MMKRVETLWTDEEFVADWDYIESECEEIVRSVQGPSSAGDHASEVGSLFVGRSFDDDLRPDLWLTQDPEDLRIALRPRLDRVLERVLGRPRVLVADDILETAFEQLIVPQLAAKLQGTPTAAGDMPKAARRRAAMISLAQRCNVAHSGPRVLLASGFAGSAFDSPIHCSMGASGLSLRIVAGRVPGRTLYGKPTAASAHAGRHVYGFLVGRCSRRAMSIARQQSSRLMRSVFSSLSIITMFEVMQQLGSSTDMPAAEVKTLDEHMTHYGVNIIRACVNAYYGIDAGPNHYTARIRSALQLQSQADATPDELVSLALGMGSLEALLVAGTNDLSQQFARRSASLLEFDSARREASARVLKKLYGLRSRFIHGDPISPGHPSRLRIRQTVSAITIGSLICYMALRDSLDREPTTTQFLEMIDTATSSGSAVMGAPRGVRLGHVLELLHNTTGP